MDSDLYIAQEILPTLLPALESLSIQIDNFMKDEKGLIDPRFKERFNPCVFLGEYFLRNNPKHNTNKTLPPIYKHFVQAEMMVNFLNKYRQNIFQVIQKFKYNTISSDQARTIVNSLDSELGFQGKLEKAIKDCVCFRITDKVTIEKFVEIMLETIATQNFVKVADIENAFNTKWPKKNK